MSNNALKLLALFFMTLDHISKDFSFLIPSRLSTAFNIIGRAAAVLFMFALINGAEHTHDRKKYLLRLYLYNILIALTTGILNTTGVLRIAAPAMIGTFFITLLYIVLIDNFIKSTVPAQKIKYFILIAAVTVIPDIIDRTFFQYLCTIVYAHSSSPIAITSLRQILRAILPDLRIVDYSPLFVGMGLMMYYCKGKFARCMTVLLASIVSFIGTYIFEAPIFFDFFAHMQFFMLLAIPFMWFYNGQKGKDIKYFFYIYYPLHIFIFSIISDYLTMNITKFNLT